MIFQTQKKKAGESSNQHRGAIRPTLQYASSRCDMATTYKHLAQLSARCGYSGNPEP